MIGLKTLITKSTTDIRSNIDSIRLQIEQHRQRIDDLEFGLISKEDSIRRLHEWADLQANKFVAHEVFGDLYIGTKFDLDNGKLEVHSRTNLFSDGDEKDPRMIAMSADSTNFTCLLFFLFGEEIKSKLTAFIEMQNIPDDCPPLSERPKMIEALNAKIKKLEIQEEELICEAEDAGFEIARHPNADPRVVLEFTD